MRNIIVVECVSTGKNYIQDIIDRNYNPIVLETRIGDDSIEGRRYRKDREECYSLIDHDFEVLYEKDTYEETLEMVREYDPLLVIPAVKMESCWQQNWPMTWSYSAIRLKTWIQ